MRWRVVLDEEPRAGSENMALDHALAEGVAARDGAEGVVRFYGWEPHTVSFGRNEPAAGRYDLEAAAREGLAFVRRPTGGRAVLHAREVTYCVAFPVGALAGLRAAYARINQGLVAGLRALGAPAELAAGGDALPPDAGPCFQVPAPGEVVLGGRKLVGSAQVRLGRAVLQHGSVILGGDQAALARISGGRADPAPPATLEGVLGAVESGDVARALGAGLGLALGGGWEQGGYHSDEKRRAVELARERYATDAWTWRR